MQRQLNHSKEFEATCITIGKKQVLVQGYKAHSVVRSLKFQRWVKTIDTTQFNIKDIMVRWADFTPKGLLFAYLDCNVEDHSHNRVPGILFFRGDAVGVLVVLEDENQDHWLVLVQQPRFPSGKTFVEIPAGMLDMEGNPIGITFNEMKEETGIEIERDKLVPLGQPTYTSPGGCDEKIYLYRYLKKVTSQEIQALQGKLTGNEDEGEQITLLIVPLDRAHAYLETDAKSELALRRYFHPF
jgi:ADP-sugar diphosphatase